MSGRKAVMYCLGGKHLCTVREKNSYALSWMNAVMHCLGGKPLCTVLQKSSYALSRRKAVRHFLGGKLLGNFWEESSITTLFIPLVIWKRHAVQVGIHANPWVNPKTDLCQWKPNFLSHHDVWFVHYQWWRYTFIHLPTYPQSQNWSLHQRGGSVAQNRVITFGYRSLHCATKSRNPSDGSQKIFKTTSRLTSGCQSPKILIL